MNEEEQNEFEDFSDMDKEELLKQLDVVDSWNDDDEESDIQAEIQDDSSKIELDHDLEETSKHSIKEEKKSNISSDKEKDIKNEVIRDDDLKSPLLTDRKEYNEEKKEYDLLKKREKESEYYKDSSRDSEKESFLKYEREKYRDRDRDRERRDRKREFSPEKYRDFGPRYRSPIRERFSPSRHKSPSRERRRSYSPKNRIRDIDKQIRRLDNYYENRNAHYRRNQQSSRREHYSSKREISLSPSPENQNWSIPNHYSSSSKQSKHSSMEIQLVKRKDLTKTPQPRGKRVPFLVEINRELSKQSNQAQSRLEQHQMPQHNIPYTNEQIMPSYPQQMYMDNHQTMNYQAYDQTKYYTNEAPNYPMPDMMNMYPPAFPTPIPPPDPLPMVSPIPLPVPPPSNPSSAPPASQYLFGPYVSQNLESETSKFSFSYSEIAEAPPPPDISKPSSSEAELLDPEVIIFRCEEALKTFRSDSRLRQSSGCFRHTWYPIQNIAFHMSRSPLLRFGFGKLSFNEPEYNLKIEKLNIAIKEDIKRRETCIECIHKKLNKCEVWSQTETSNSQLVDAEVQVDLNHSESFNYVSFDNRFRRDNTSQPPSRSQSSDVDLPRRLSPVTVELSPWLKEQSRRIEADWQRKNQPMSQHISPSNHEYMQRQNEFMKTKSLQREEDTFQNRFPPDRGDNQMFIKNSFNNQNPNEIFRKQEDKFYWDSDVQNQEKFPRMDKDFRQNSRLSSANQEPGKSEMRNNLSQRRPNRNMNQRGRGGRGRKRKNQAQREEKKAS